jgi:plasmid stabilization system protein ParE
MAFEIVWTKRAAAGYDNIITYLQENWTDREVENFLISTNKFFETLSIHPEILQKSNKQKKCISRANK